MKRYKINWNTVKRNILIIIAIATFITVWHNAQCYTIKATVKETTTTTTTFEDITGELWTWDNEKNDNWVVGQQVKIKFYSPIPEAATRQLDEIEKIKVQ